MISATGAAPPVALLVQQGSTDRDRIGHWLEDAGFDVMGCSGPSPPDYSCIGAKTWACPLVHGADLIVLDLSLASDAAMDGVSSLELLLYYISTGTPLVALTHGSAVPHMFAEERFAAVPWPPTRPALLSAIRDVLRGPGTRARRPRVGATAGRREERWT